MLVTSIFSFSPECFLHFPKLISNFESHIFFSSVRALSLDQSRILSFDGWLTKVIYWPAIYVM